MREFIWYKSLFNKNRSHYLGSSEIKQKYKNYRTSLECISEKMIIEKRYVRFIGKKQKEKIADRDEVEQQKVEKKHKPKELVKSHC